MMNVQSRPKNDNVTDILIPFPVGKAYSYLINGCDVTGGQFVTVPLGKKQTIGVVWSDAENPNAVDPSKLKPVVVFHDAPPMPEVHRKFLSWVSDYTMADLGSVLKMSLPKPAEEGFLKTSKKPDVSPCQDIVRLKTDIDLSNDQAAASKKLSEAVTKNAFSVYVLDGVTGAGKTEVYFEALAEAFRLKKQVLVLLPEIGLSPQFVDRFERRFGVKPALWHSDVTPSNKRKIWHGVLRGETRCVAGARSALMLPFTDLGLIVVDEEHDTSYKQEEGVMYNARDMAVVRSMIGQIPVILSSATPSLETMENVWSGKYSHVVLPSRFGHAIMPDIKLIDMKSEKMTSDVFLSGHLREALMDTAKRSEQSLLFLNRRGYAPLTLCRVCGYRFQCPSCSAWLVEHRKTGCLHCHHCQYEMSLPKDCPECDTAGSLVACGPGVERIAEEVQSILPDARLLTLSSDITNSPKAMDDAITRILSGDIDVIIGTQMIAKGHHFPKLTTVGVVDADIGLSGGDLRAGERTYQLLQQVSGRAGRSDRAGTVYIQSFVPEHPVMQALVKQDRDRFLELEAGERHAAHMPPYGKIAALIVSGPKDETVIAYARQLARLAPQYKNVTVLGPGPALMPYLRGKHRWRFLIKTEKDVKIQPVIERWVKSVKRPSNVQLKIDIDPQSFF